MVKARTPTLCEWALGFTIEDYVQNKERRQNKNGGKTSPRFKLEMSTDDESGEDSLKITYPRSEQTPTAATTKKVRFEKTPVKSALKKPAPETESSSAAETTTEAESTTEAETTTDAETTTEAETTSGAEQSSDAADTSNSSKSSTTKKKGKRFAISYESSDADSTDDSAYDSDCSCRKCRHRARHLTKLGKDKCKNSKSSSTSGSDTSSSEAEEKKQKKSPKGKKGSPESNKSKKKSTPAQESENDGEDESSSEEETPKKAKKTKGEKGGKDKKKDESSSADKEDGDAKEKRKGGKNKAKSSADNNVGPQKEVSADTPENTEKSGDKKSKEKNKKPLPDPGLSPDLRRPNLILPVTAQVLQVEHAIEAMEDPRPNAFHDSHHGVVRVYHGPAYGNPYGTLYPVRDATKAMLPVGTPHPLMNPYLNGFKTTNNPDELANPHWSAHMPAPIPNAAPEKPPSPPQQRSSPPQQRCSPPQQPQAPVVDARQSFSPPMVPTMSGALNPNSPQFAHAYSPEWAHNMKLHGYPVNVNMYSYGAPIRRDSWSKEGRERYAKIARDHQINRSVHRMMSGSCENNAGPAMYDRSAYQGSPQNNNGGNGSRGSLHPDLQWGDERPEVTSWINSQRAPSAVGASGDAPGDPWGTNANGNGSNGWGGEWGANPNSGDNNSRSGSKNNNNSPHASRSGGGSNNGNTQAADDGWGNAADLGSWGGGDNNVGASSRASNGSQGSKGSRHSQGSRKSRNGGSPINTGWDNNAGPMQAQTDDPWNKPEDPSNNMPGAFKDDQGGGGMANVTFHQSTEPVKDNGGFPWGDTSCAQGEQQW